MIEVTIEIKRERPFRVPVKDLCEKFYVQFFYEITDESIMRFHKLKIVGKFKSLIDHQDFIEELDKIINY